MESQEGFWNAVFVVGGGTIFMVVGLAMLTVIVTFLQGIMFGCGCP